MASEEKYCSKCGREIKQILKNQATIMRNLTISLEVDGEGLVSIKKRMDETADILKEGGEE